jgi:hypothetical protein
LQIERAGAAYAYARQGYTCRCRSKHLTDATGHIAGHRLRPIGNSRGNAMAVNPVQFRIEQTDAKTGSAKIYADRPLVSWGCHEALFSGSRNFFDNDTMRVPGCPPVAAVVAGWPAPMYWFWQKNS